MVTWNDRLNYVVQWSECYTSNNTERKKLQQGCITLVTICLILNRLILIASIITNFPMNSLKTKNISLKAQKFRDIWDLLMDMAVYWHKWRCLQLSYLQLQRNELRQGMSHPCRSYRECRVWPPRYEYKGLSFLCSRSEQKAVISTLWSVATLRNMWCKTAIMLIRRSITNYLFCWLRHPSSVDSKYWSHVQESLLNLTCYFSSKKVRFETLFSYHGLTILLVILTKYFSFLRWKMDPTE
jgi:hypothetical protein